ncbi:MAG: O-Antigen ligase [Frankiales bacterium]|nr:O-Antigen ligase [Frankiales bacterium]
MTCWRLPAGAGRMAAITAAGGGLILAGAALGALGAATSPWLLTAVPLALVALVAGCRSPLAAVATAFLLAPVGLVAIGPVKGAQALTVLALGCLVGARLLGRRSPLPVLPPLLWGGALLAVCVLSTGTAVDLGLAVKQDVAIASGLALAGAVVAVCSDLRRWLVVVRCLLIGATAICLPALTSARHLESRYGGAVVNERPVGVFSQPNELGAYAMLTALLAVGLLLGARGRRDRWLAGVALVASTAAMLVSLSRGAWIGAVLGLVTVVVLVPRARRLVAIGGTVVVLAGALLGAFAPDSAPVQVVAQRVDSLVRAEHNPYDDRPRLWREALRQTRERPVLGHGPGSFPVAAARYGSVASTVGADHAHDVLLTASAEAGLLGLAALLALTVSTARRVLRSLRTARDPTLLGVLGGAAAALAGLIGEGLVDVTLRNALLAQTVWGILGLALAGTVLALRPEQPSAPTDPAARPLVML